MFNKYSSALERRLERNNASSIMDEETMTPRHWLGSVFYMPVSALTLLVGWQEGRPAH